MRVSDRREGSRSEALTDENSPYVDKDEQRNVGEFLQREKKRENMVRHTLSKPVQRMKRMAGIRCGHDPLVVWLVENSVHFRVMQTPVNPIYEEVGKGNEERNLEVVVQGEGSVRWRVVKFCVAAHFADEEWGCEDSHERHGDQTLLDLQADLVFEIFGVGKGSVVENKEIGDGCADKVDYGAEEPEEEVSDCLEGAGRDRPCDKIQSQCLSPYIIS